MRVSVIPDRGHLELARQIAREVVHTSADDKERRTLARVGELGNREVGVRPWSIVEREGDGVAGAAAAIDRQTEPDEALDRCGA